MSVCLIVFVVFRPAGCLVSVQNNSTGEPNLIRRKERLRESRVQITTSSVNRDGLQVRIMQLFAKESESTISTDRFGLRSKELSSNT